MTPSTQTPRITRRGFVLGAAGTATLAAASLFGCAPREAPDPTVDETVSCDVLVIGGGAAGTTAAAEAALAGAKTVLIEKTPWLSGSSSLAIGTLYGAGTQLQQAAGIEDTPEGLLAYFMERGGDKLDPAMQQFCAEHFGETIDWLSGELNVPFKEKISKKGTDTIARAHNIDDRDEVALAAVEQYAKDAGVDFVFDTQAVELIVNDEGEVEGVLAVQGADKRIRYDAGRTILATGGFCRNEDLIAEYCPDYDGVYTEVGQGCTGEGLEMGLDIGAAYIGHGGTNGILACPVEAGQSKLIDSKAMWVDSSGNRFVNEGGQTHDIYYTVAHFPDQSFYAVYDQPMVDTLSDKLANAFQLGLDQGVFTQGDTVAEAAEALGIDGAALQAQLDAYNAMAAAGEDTQFGKKADNLVAIETGPFYVLTMGVCTHGSFGGYHVNTDFQVLDETDTPIPNLYAAGEVCCGEFIYDDYPAGGCGLNYAYTSGRYAGKNAAAAVQA
ncbi:FAD-dependent oxidoreductase [Adlercreutzia aquisgranensis]|uniref:FAD-dependent oxidoreductase n=1 Tax=Muribaculaceae bacterium Z82 TaxID=2304548 RepID=A0A7C9JQQ0_9BACT|nr:FAD-dependent oxidoreductase [Adlercreutzia aquisgranensis]